MEGPADLAETTPDCEEEPLADAAAGSPFSLASKMVAATADMAAAAAAAAVAATAAATSSAASEAALPATAETTAVTQAVAMKVLSASVAAAAEVAAEVAAVVAGAVRVKGVPLRKASDSVTPLTRWPGQRAALASARNYARRVSVRAASSVIAGALLRG